MRININKILFMWNLKDYSKEERLNDLKSIIKYHIKNPYDYFRLLVYTECFKCFDTDNFVSP